MEASLEQGATAAPHLVFDWNPEGDDGALRTAVGLLSADISGPVGPPSLPRTRPARDLLVSPAAPRPPPCVRPHTRRRSVSLDPRRNVGRTPHARYDLGALRRRVTGGFAALEPWETRAERGTACAEPSRSVSSMLASSEGAAPTEWTEAHERLADAEIFWISTVWGDGRPHVTPLIAVLMDDSLYFCTGPDEQKARNLEGNRHCTLTTGCNDIDEGLDVVVEGEAARHGRDGAPACGRALPVEVRPRVALRRPGRGRSRTPRAPASRSFEVAPRKAFGFRKGDEFSQTRWQFPGS